MPPAGPSCKNTHAFIVINHTKAVVKDFLCILQFMCDGIWSQNTSSFVFSSFIHLLWSFHPFMVGNLENEIKGKQAEKVKTISHIS